MQRRVNGNGRNGSSNGAADRFARLTRRERQVMERVINGMTTREIADDLGASYRTIETHRSRIMIKMQVRRLADLVRVAVRDDVFGN